MDEFTLISDEFVKTMASLSEQEASRYLFVENHPSLLHYFLVNSVDISFINDFKDILGPRRAFSPFSYPKFKARADELGYTLMWIDDPVEQFEWANSLVGTPEVEIASFMPNTVNGFLPFQLQGFNFGKELPAFVANWSTGTGKTVLATALTKYHREKGNYDLCMWVVKTNNKINTKRSIKMLTGLDSTVIDGPIDKRLRQYLDLAAAMKKEPQIMILNYEKFRDDEKWLAEFCKGRKIFIVWDEMPTKLKNRQTQLYRAVSRCLYKTPTVPKSEKKWPSELRQVMLSATPIENSPEDWFNCVRLLDPDLYGNVTTFHANYVAAYSPFDQRTPVKWKNLADMGAQAAAITHQVDKTDPDIAAMFPRVIHTPIYVDFDTEHGKLHDLLNSIFIEDALNNPEDQMSILGKIGVAQMLMDSPEMVANSGVRYAEFIDELKAGEFPSKRGSEVAKMLVDRAGLKRLHKVKSSKYAALKDILDETDGKVIIFTVFNQSLLPILEREIGSWGYKVVQYHGGMSMKQKQDAEDAFKNNPNIKVFLSSDSGSDSINLEVANTVVHYDLPYKWSTRVQRENRAHRITSTFSEVRIYSLIMAGTVEDRRVEIISKKQGFHEAVMKGEVADQSEGIRITQDDLRYILYGTA